MARFEVVKGGQRGSIVEFHKPLSEAEAAEIDAKHDDYEGADFFQVASAGRRALAAAGAIRMIAMGRATPEALYFELTDQYSRKLIAENFDELDRVLALLQAVRGMHK